MPSSSSSPTPLLTTLLLLDLPANSFVGIDLLAFTSTTRFSGIKHIPRGFHNIYYTANLSPFSSTPISTSSSSRPADLDTTLNHNFNLRHGFWLHARGTPDDIIIKKWNKSKEELVGEEEMSKEEVLRIKANLGKLYNGHLTPYRQRDISGGGGEAGEAGGMEFTSDSRMWRELVGYVTGGLLDRVLVGPEPRGGVETLPESTRWKITTTCSSSIDFEDVLASTPIPPSPNSAPTTSSTDFSSSLPPSSSSSSFSPSPSETLHLTPINLKRTFPASAIGRARTEAAKDRSWYLSHLATTYCHPPAYSPYSPPTTTSLEDSYTDLLGELQFCYISAMTLANYSCMEQWKRILGLMLTCLSCVREKAEFFQRLLEILIVQFRALEVLGEPGGGAGVAGTAATVGIEGIGTGDGGGGGGGSGGSDAAGGGGGGGGYLGEFIESGGDTSAQKLLRGFLRNLKFLHSEAPPPPPPPSYRDSDAKLDPDPIPTLLTLFTTLEDLTLRKFDWILDTSKVVKRGMMQLEDGEMVEMEMDDMGSDEEEERGEYAPVVVEGVE